MYPKVIEMFGARVNWLLDTEAPSTTIESIVSTFGRSAPVIDTLMLLYPFTAREKVARDFLDTRNKLLPPVAPVYEGKTKRLTEFADLEAHFSATVNKAELERNRRWGSGLREILYDHRVHPSDMYLQARLRLFTEFLFGYVARPHAFTVVLKPEEADQYGVVTTGWVTVTLHSDPAGPSFAIYNGPI